MAFSFQTDFTAKLHITILIRKGQVLTETETGKVKRGHKRCTKSAFYTQIPCLR